MVPIPPRLTFNATLALAGSGFRSIQLNKVPSALPPSSQTDGKMFASSDLQMQGQKHEVENVLLDADLNANASASA